MSERIRKYVRIYQDHDLQWIDELYRDLIQCCDANYGCDDNGTTWFKLRALAELKRITCPF